MFIIKDSHPGDTRLEGCRVCADLTSGPLPLERRNVKKTNP